MTSNRQPDVEIRIAKPIEWKLALEVLWSDVDPDIRRQQIINALIAASEDPSTLEGFIVCMVKGGLVGSMLASVQPGNYAVLSKPSYIAPDYSDLYRQCCSQLIKRCSHWAIEQGASLLQCLLEPEALDAKSCFEECGYTAFTNIEYMAIGTQTNKPIDGRPFVMEQVDPTTERQRWKEILYLTYNQTLDCPFLSGRRDLDSVIEGYMNTGDFDPKNWTILTSENIDIGCLITTQHLAAKQTELIYFGIIAGQRGKGIGKHVVEAAIANACEHESVRLILAVDQNNRPAKEIYQHLGFSRWESRIAMLKFV